MTDHPPPPGLDPTRDAALLLQRMGFFVLGVALPVSAVVSRRAAVVLVPIGVALMVIAAFLIEPDRLFRSFRRRAVKATALALGVMAGWALLSSQWAPRGAAGVDRALNMALALALGVAGIAALAERTRTANLNAVRRRRLGLSALFVLVVSVFRLGLGGDIDDGGTLLVRALALVVILAAPLTAWLLLRGRNGSAGALLGVVAFAVLAVASPVATAAFVAALLGALLVLRAGAPAVRALAWLLAGVVLIAPFAALMAAQSGAGRFPALASWGDIIARAPAQVVTGFGFDAIAVQGMAGLLPAALPTVDPVRDLARARTRRRGGVRGGAVVRDAGRAGAAAPHPGRRCGRLSRGLHAGRARAREPARLVADDHRGRRGADDGRGARPWPHQRPVAGFIRAAGGEPGASAPKA